MTRRYQEAPLKAGEQCAELRRKFEEGSVILRATIPGVASGGAASSGKSTKGGLHQASPLADGVEKEAEEVDGGAGGEEEEVMAVGGPAQIKVSTEGGPYNGCVFKLSLEEEGEARMLGRSTGKKVRMG